MSIYLGNTEILKIYLGSTEVPKAYLGTVEVYGTGPQPIDYSKEYFTISAIEPGTITWAPTGTTEYSVNKGAWDTWNGSLAVNAGDKVRFRSTGNTTYQGKTVQGSAKYDVEGNIMSLLYGDNFSGQTTLSTNNVFFRLFGQFAPNTTLINAGNLVLPATTLANFCYQNMFNNCVNLETAPELPATTLRISCYSGMFDGCTSIRTLPSNYLPATALSMHCYEKMFQGCINLTNAPELPAQYVSNYSYKEMFANCTSLTATPILLGRLETGCYERMFLGCTSLTATTTLPATTLQLGCYQGMFGGCTSLTTAPDLPATTLKKGCYQEMFSGCTNLSSIKCLAENISAADCTTNWTSGVAASGTFTKSPNMSSWTTDANGIPAGWTVADAT